MDNTTPDVKNDGQPVAENEALTQTPQKQVLVASGETVTLGEREMAILVTFNPETGVPSVYDVQNTPLRIYSKMLLNEALSLYQLSAISGATASVLEATLVKAIADKKKGFTSPFGK